MPSTPALSTPSAGAPFDKTTIERRARAHDDVEIDIKYCGICHSDIHQVARRVGRLDLPDGARSRDRGRRDGGRPRTREQFSVGDRVGCRLHGRLLRGVRVLRRRRGAVLHKGNVQTYNGRDYDGDPDVRRLQPVRSWSRSASSSSIPDGIELPDAAPLLCARHHDLLAAEALEVRARGRRSRWSGWAASATSACRSPPRWAPR